MPEENIHPAPVGDARFEEEVREHRNEVTQDRPDERIRNGPAGPPGDNGHDDQGKASAGEEMREPVEAGLVGEVKKIERDLDRYGENAPAADRQEPTSHAGAHGVTLSIVSTSFSLFAIVGSRVRYRTMPSLSTMAYPTGGPPSRGFGM